MVGPSEISTIMTSLRSAKDILEAMSNLRDAATLQSKVVELQGKILDAQGAAFSAQDARTALVQRVGELESEVARLEAWEREKQRYDLTEIRPGVFAYAVKDGMRGPEPAHHVCARCYEDGKKSILQMERRAGAVDVMVCHRCGSELTVDGIRRDGPRPTHAKTSRRQ